MEKGCVLIGGNRDYIANIRSLGVNQGEGLSLNRMLILKKNFNKIRLAINNSRLTKKF
jgi:hypothetical protein